MADSAVALRVSCDGSRIDTIAGLRGRMRDVEIVAREVRGVGMWLSDPFAVGEQALLFRDGWIAVARLSPYRVEWISPAGERTLGPPIAERLISVSQQDKQAALSSYFGNSALSIEMIPSWPTQLPAFQESALFSSPQGFLVVRRTSVAASPEGRYDVFDRRGIRVHSFNLPGGHRLVGIGDHYLYVAVRDTDDIERLQRVRWIQ
jgi:hypothetical protein